MFNLPLFDFQLYYPTALLPIRPVLDLLQLKPVAHNAFATFASVFAIRISLRSSVRKSASYHLPQLGKGILVILNLFQNDKKKTSGKESWRDSQNKGKIIYKLI